MDQKTDPCGRFFYRCKQIEDGIRLIHRAARGNFVVVYAKLAHK